MMAVTRLYLIHLKLIVSVTQTMSVYIHNQLNNHKMLDKFLIHIEHRGLLLSYIHHVWMNGSFSVPFNTLLGYIGTATSEGMNWRMIVLSDIQLAGCEATLAQYWYEVSWPEMLATTPRTHTIASVLRFRGQRR